MQVSCFAKLLFFFLLKILHIFWWLLNQCSRWHLWEETVTNIPKRCGRYLGAVGNDMAGTATLQFQLLLSAALAATAIVDV